MKTGLIPTTYEFPNSYRSALPSHVALDDSVWICVAKTIQRHLTQIITGDYRDRMPPLPRVRGEYHQVGVAAVRGDHLYFEAENVNDLREVASPNSADSIRISWSGCSSTAPGSRCKHPCKT